MSPQLFSDFTHLFSVNGAEPQALKHLMQVSKPILRATMLLHTLVNLAVSLLLPVFGQRSQRCSALKCPMSGLVVLPSPISLLLVHRDSSGW